MTDLLLVTPASRARVYQELAAELSAIEPPVWSGLIATYARARGHEVKILDAEALGLGPDETAARIAELAPALCVFSIYGQQPSASTQCMPAGRAVARKLAELAPGLPTLALGTHPSALPERTLREEPYEFVCQGEGPITIAALLGELKSGRRDFARVPGLWYREAGEVRSTAPASKIAELDRELPGQAWDLLDLSLYRAHNWHSLDALSARMPYASVQTSLGCPYACAFCCINAPFGGAGIRYWSPEAVVRQIDFLATRHGIRNVKIPDEMFVLNERHVTGICDGLVERGHDLNLWAYARVDTVRKPELLTKMRRAGFRWLVLGIESGSKHVRDGVEKGRFGNTQIREAVARVRDAGIHVLGNYIFGLPDDTRESMRETLELALELRTEWANFYSAMAYPGSALHARAVAAGWRLPDDWGGYSQHAIDTLPLPTETLSGPEVLEFRDRAHAEYFSDAGYLARVRESFGEPAVAHVTAMNQLRLQRRFRP
jgi:radical SAM superfamily enzyme YgiQ (UPF0313 family)